MTYWQTADLSENGDWRQRILGVAIEEVNPEPEHWAFANRNKMVTKEMADAYAYALSQGKTPTEAATDITVITEGMILSRYQFLTIPPSG